MYTRLLTLSTVGLQYNDVDSEKRQYEPKQENGYRKNPHDDVVTINSTAALGYDY